MWNFNRYKTCALGLIGLQVALLLTSASVHNPIDDELAHLPCGIIHWKTGDRTLYHVNPPLVRMVAAVPVMALYPNLVVPTFEKSTEPSDRPEFMVAYHFLQSNGNPMLCSIYFWARSLCILFPLLGALVCWLWSLELYGEFAGLLSMLLWTTCPLVLGWGSTIYPDVPAASLWMLAAYLFWRWTCCPNWSRACWAGMAMGAALLTKLTLLYMIVVPFPEQYVLGFDTQRREFEAVLWSYLNGRHQKGGWYHYYLFTACIKLPIGTFALFGIASLLTISQIIKRQPNAAEWFVIAPASVLILVISSQTGIKHLYISKLAYPSPVDTTAETNMDLQDLQDECRSDLQ